MCTAKAPQQAAPTPIPTSPAADPYASPEAAADAAKPVTRRQLRSGGGLRIGTDSAAAPPTLGIRG